MGQFKEMFGRYTRELDRLSQSSKNAASIIRDSKGLLKDVVKYRDILRAQEEIIRKEIDRKVSRETKTEFRAAAPYYSGGYEIIGEQEGGVKYAENIDLFMEASKILNEEILKAVKENVEYDHSYFIGRLQSVAFNEKIFFINNSWSRYNMFVKIDFGSVAGNLEDYAHGVVEAREAFNVKDWHELSQHFWQEKLYDPARRGIPVEKKRKRTRGGKGITPEVKTARQVGKYWSTMFKRMDASGKIAPFWELLDKGSQPMSSDRGGNPYPLAKRTDFIRRAEDRILTLLRGELHTDWYEERIPPDIRKEEANLRNLQEYIQGLNLLLNDIEDLLKKLERPGEIPTPEAVAIVIEKTTERLGRQVKEIKPDKMAALIQAIQTNDFSRVSITKDGRFEVTAALAKQLGLKRTRVTVNVIRKMMLQMGRLD